VKSKLAVSPNRAIRIQSHYFICRPRIVLLFHVFVSATVVMEGKLAV